MSLYLILLQYLKRSKGTLPYVPSTFPFCNSDPSFNVNLSLAKRGVSSFALLLKIKDILLSSTRQNGGGQPEPSFCHPEPPRRGVPCHPLVCQNREVKI